MKNKERLDKLIVDLGLAETRSRAQALILAGKVRVCGQPVTKAGTPVHLDSEVTVDEGRQWASRGAYKLLGAFEAFSDFSAEGRVCADIGASTGGFTDVLLSRGAKRVFAVDVGYGQLAWKLRTDERVVNLERTNLRYVTHEQVPETLDLAVMDVSFISIRLVIPAVRELLKPEGDVICLIKPQFEAGRENVGKKGVVRDAAVHRAVLESFLAFFPEAGFTLMGLDYSPIRGPEGNIEFLAWLKKGVHDAPEFDVSALVEASHKEFST